MCDSFGHNELPLEVVEGVAFDSVSSLARQQFQRHVKRTSHKHRDRWGDYRAAYLRGQSIQTIARDAGFSPYLLSRLFVERLLAVDKRCVGKAMKDVESIPDPRLRAEVQQCVAVDLFCSPRIDRVRAAVGAEYEYILHASLHNRGVPFESESALRLRSCDKTPDALLSVPIAVMGPNGKVSIATWIDSKAMFGDLSPGAGASGRTDVADQAVSYANRFGPGIIIYWFNFVASIDLPDVLCIPCFPDHVFLAGDEDSVDDLCPDFLGNSDALSVSF